MADYQPDNPFMDPTRSGELAQTIQPAPDASTATNYKTDPNQVRAWYQQYLGRGAENDSVVNAWAGQDAQTAQAGIANSAEAQAYKAKQAPAAAAPAAKAAPAAPAASQFQYQAPAVDPNYSRMVQALVGRALSQPTASPDDPNVQASTAAYGADQTRSGRDFLSSLAEKGGSHMNMDAATLSAGEKVGQNTANFRAALVQKNLDAERQMIADALNGSLGLLTAQQTAALRQRDQELGAAQFNASTAQQGWEDQYQSIFG
jgi:hypothetical protein